MGIGEFLVNIAPYVLYSIGIIAVCASLVKPKWGILFLIPVLPLDSVLSKMQSFPLGKDFIDIMLIALIIGWFLKTLFNKVNLFEGSALNIIILFLIIYTFLSYYIGNNYLKDFSSFDITNSRLQTWKNYVILPLIFLIVLNNIRDKKHLKWLVYLMMFVIFLMSFKFFRNYRFIDKSYYRDGMRWTGTFTYLGPNEYAAFFSHYLFIALGILLSMKSKLIRVFLLSAVGLSLYSVIFLFSRGSYVATYLTIALSGFLRKNLIVIIAVITLSLAWHTLLPRSVVERIEMTTNESNELESSAEKRVQIWKTSMDLFKANYVSGIGFGTFPYLGFTLGDTHNLYVKILLEQGVVGFLIFLIMILVALFNGWKLYINARDDFLKGLGFGFVMCTISLLISNFFGDRWTYVPLGAYYWVFMALVVRGNIITQKEIRNKNRDKRKKVLA
jgi:O-antigen ligase